MNLNYRIAGYYFRRCANESDGKARREFMALARRADEFAGAEDAEDVESVRDGRPREQLSLGSFGDIPAMAVKCGKQSGLPFVAKAGPSARSISFGEIGGWMSVFWGLGFTRADP